MPFPPQHKQQTRQRIVESARGLFNRRGFTEVSIDEIMAGAGLTRGGFYNHFKSKEELYTETIHDYALRREGAALERRQCGPGSRAAYFFGLRVATTPRRPGRAVSVDGVAV